MDAHGTQTLTQNPFQDPPAFPAVRAEGAGTGGWWGVFWFGLLVLLVMMLPPRNTK